MTEHLTVGTRATDAGVVVELAGELDHDTAEQVRTILSALPLQAGHQLTLDLGGVTFCDSSGITVLIAARNQSLAAGAHITLAAVPESVARILRLLGLDQIFPTHSTAGDAESAWHTAAD